MEGRQPSGDKRPTEALKKTTSDPENIHIGQAHRTTENLTTADDPWYHYDDHQVVTPIAGQMRAAPETSSA